MKPEPEPANRGRMHDFLQRHWRRFSTFCHDCLQLRLNRAVGRPCDDQDFRNAVDKSPSLHRGKMGNMTEPIDDADDLIARPVRNFQHPVTALIITVDPYDPCVQQLAAQTLEIIDGWHFSPEIEFFARFPVHTLNEAE